ADPRDRRLIQTLGLRLVAGQQTTGGWTYHCRDMFTPAEELVFFDILQQTRPKDPLKLFDGDKKDERMAFFLGMKDRQDLTTGRLEAPTTRSMETPWTGPLFGQQAKVTVGRIESTSPNAASLPLEQIKSPKTPLDRVPPKFRDIPVLRPLPSARELPAGD